MVAQQRPMSAEFARIRIGPAEDFTKPSRKMLDVSGPAVCAEEWD